MMCVHCFDILLNELQKNARNETLLVPPTSTATTAVVECPLFVTWEKLHGERYELRGCIGTLSPRRLVTALGEYAHLSAFRDRRFRPISATEVPQLRVSVSLLISYEECTDWKDWVVGVHGVVLNFQGETSQQYSATYLPEVAQQQQWDHHQAISSLIRKAGFKGTIDLELLGRLRCTRYQSSKVKLTFDEYAQICHNQGRPVGSLQGGSTPTSCVIL